MNDPRGRTLQRLAILTCLLRSAPSAVFARDQGVIFRLYTELFGLLDRRSWPTQTERSHWYGLDPDLTERPVNPLAGN